MKQFCSVVNCDRVQAAKSYCHMHYNRWRRHGDPNIARRMCRRGSGIQERLDLTVDRSGGPNACWNFTGAVNRTGYGWLQIDGVTKGVHVWAYEVSNGPIPSSLLVRHSCDNRLCANPRHLSVGSHQDNMNDKVERGRQSRLQGVRNPNHKLSEAEVRAIRDSALGPRELAVQYSVSVSLIGMIRQGKRWAHIDDGAHDAVA